MDHQPGLTATIEACKRLIATRFDDDADHGAAAVLLEDGTILTGTAPEAINPAVQVCHEIEPYCADSHPDIDSSDKPHPGPATSNPRTKAPIAS
jgi:hypothetical protein